MALKCGVEHLIPSTDFGQLSDRFLQYTVKFGDLMQVPSVTELIVTSDIFSDRCPWDKIVNNPTGPLYDLLPPTRPCRQTVRQVITLFRCLLGQSILKEILYTK